MNEIGLYVPLFIFGVFIAACSQILLKISANKAHRDVKSEYLNYHVILAYFMFGLSMLIAMYILRFVSISLVPILESAIFVFVPILSRLILNEKLKKLQVLGIILICLGIVTFNM